MKNFPNIEKLPGNDHYTGYCEGSIYSIVKLPGGGWRAVASDTSFVHLSIIRNTLEGISNELTQRAQLIKEQNER